MIPKNSQIGKLIEEACAALKSISLYSVGNKMCAGWSVDGPFVSLEENQTKLNVSKHQQMLILKNAEILKSKMAALKEIFEKKPSTRGVEDFQILCLSSQFGVYFGGIPSDMSISKPRSARTYVVRILNKLDKADIEVNADSPWYVTFDKFSSARTSVSKQEFHHASNKTQTSTPQLLTKHNQTGHAFVRAQSPRDAVMISEIIKNPYHGIETSLKGCVALELHQDFS